MIRIGSVEDVVLEPGRSGRRVVIGGNVLPGRGRGAEAAGLRGERLDDFLTFAPPVWTGSCRSLAGISKRR